MFQEIERHGTLAMTNREWLFTLSDEKLANVMSGIVQGSLFYTDPIGYICKWLKDTRDSFRDNAAQKKDE